MALQARRIEGWLPLLLVALSGFVLALLSAFLPRVVGVALLAVAFLGAGAAGTIVARRRGGVARALLAGVGPAVGAGAAGVLLASRPIRDFPFHLGSGLGLGVCAVLVGFGLGAADRWLGDGPPRPPWRDVVGFVALLVVGATLVAATAPYAAVHVPRLLA
ncbi:hypothetical protein [Natronomonas marina]|jgi:hypothetical protein|uniref:hypothetical protein n=1 Tax=Natronomonas marina TaxID=2961939 RepID=UPI0020C9EF23|nr:hypothetical protein [Natronomonas marina]